MEKAPPELQNWFLALKKHPKYRDVVANMEETEEGIEVRIAILGMFGVKASTILSMMEKADMVVGKSRVGQGIVLKPELKSYLIGQDES